MRCWREGYTRESIMCSGSTSTPAALYKMKPHDREATDRMVLDVIPSQLIVGVLERLEHMIRSRVHTRSCRQVDVIWRGEVLMMQEQEGDLEVGILSPAGRKDMQKGSWRLWCVSSWPEGHTLCFYPSTDDGCCSRDMVLRWMQPLPQSHS